MTIYQGENLVFEGQMKDDAGEVMALTGKSLSFLLRQGDKEYAFWSTTQEGDNKIAVSGNTFMFNLPDSLTKTLPIGQYTLEQKVENADGDIIIGIVEKQIKIAKSNIGIRE